MEKYLSLFLFYILFSIICTAQQNVGIGTNNPEYPLDVNGRMRLRHNGGTPGIWLNKADNSSASFVGQQSDSVFGIWHSDANNWRIGFDHKNNRVGIGTFTPAYPLSFSNTLGDKISLWGGANSPGNNHYGLGVQGSLLQIFVPGNGDNIAFGTGRSNAFIEHMRITGNGRVGIGTNNPSYPVTLSTSTAGGGFVHTFTTNSVSVGTFANAGGGWLQTYTNHPLHLGAFNGDAALTVATSKNIGIGTTNPTTNLDVNGTIRVRGGTPGNGQVLTSDANGLASWEPVPQSALYATILPNQNIPTGINTKLNFRINPTPDNAALEFNDFATGFNNATGEFTVPANEGGVYSIETDVHLAFLPNNILTFHDYYLMVFVTNQSGLNIVAQTYLRSRPLNNNFEWNIDKASAIVKLSPGDKVAVYLQHDMDNAHTATVHPNYLYSYFRIVRLY